MQATPLRAYLAGLTHETNTFSPIPTSAESFVGGSWRPGDLNTVDTLGYGHFADLCAERGVTCVAGPFLLAGPSGPLVARDHRALRDEVLRGLREAGPVDVVFLFMHGAQVAEGCDDVEGELVAAVRAMVGPDVPIGLLLDLHGNVTPAMLREALVVACLEYPHTDYRERTRQVFDLLCATARGTVRPVTLAWRLPIVGIHPTTIEPMRSFVARLRALQSTPGILSISAFHGFLLADVVHAGSMLVVIAESDAAHAERIGETLAHAFAQTVLSTPRRLDFEAALDDVLAGPAWPVVMSDSGDNPGGGAAGDSTFVLASMLRRGVHDAAFGMLWDPIAADFAHRAGEGATLDLRIGGKVSALSGAPLDVRATVTCVRSDVRQALFAQGEPRLALGRSAALRVDGIDIVLASERHQVFDPRCFTAHGIDPAQRRLVVVKSSTHFQNGFAGLAARMVLADTPGSVSLDLAQMPFRHVRRPLYPLDGGFVPTPSRLALDAAA